MIFYKKLKRPSTVYIFLYTKNTITKKISKYDYSNWFKMRENFCLEIGCCILRERYKTSI